MPSDVLYEQFANAQRAVVVAPAGCGKTELIARGVRLCTSKQLVLTHTHAGVDALRRRLRNLKVPSSRYRVETIHSFAMRYASAYPNKSSVKNIMPQTNEDFTDIIISARRLLNARFVREVLQLTYAGIFVDEYQDCTLDQHDLIMRLAEILPCRIVGDPLQGIYDFGRSQIVDWDRNVYPSFSRLPNLIEPWRWKDANLQMGKWLMETVRPALERKEPLVLPQEPQVCRWTYNSPPKQISVLKSALAEGDTTFAICAPTKKPVPHELASRMGNRYRSIEPITSGEIRELAAQIETMHGVDRLQAVFNFAFQCLTGILTDCRAILDAITKQKLLRSQKRTALLEISRRICDEPSLTPVSELFAFIEREYSPTITRYQLWTEMKKGLRECISGSHPTLSEAVWSIRNRMSIMGRRTPKRCISRTVLLKGLECDHAIVVDADSLDTKNLYVALTRGSQYLHILSNDRFLWATDARRSCPRCQSQLTLRSGKHGHFIGCGAYPDCAYTESFKGPSSSS